MIITPQFITTKMGGRNIKHYKNLGYDVKLYDSIKVPVDHLPFGSHEKIQIICDYCGEFVYKAYKNLINERKTSMIKKDCCQNCIVLKTSESNLMNYGVENPMQREEVQQKLKNIFMELYGVENPTQNIEIKSRSLAWQTNSSEEEKKDRKIRTQTTMIKKYGVKCGLQMIKCKQNLFKTREIGSSQQKIIYHLLKNKYGEDIVIFNYIYENLCLDIFMFLNDIKIDVEYDSLYWHDDFKRDRKRDEFLKTRDFKILRIKSGKMIPDENILFDKIYFLINSDYKYTEIVLTDWNEELYLKGRDK